MTPSEPEPEQDPIPELEDMIARIVAKAEKQKRERNDAR